MLYKTWTHKSYIKDFSFTTRQVAQQRVSLGVMTLDRKSPNRSCLFGSDLNTSTWFAPTSDKRSQWILIWADSRSSGFIMPSILPTWRNAKPQGEDYNEKNMKGLPTYDKSLVLCEAACHPSRCRQGSNKSISMRGF
jgi:hypothetical protein